ncbi:membrane dipeptidase [Candidatus Uhrbacteria bacterium]|nr:membrane dipeptidase [Candidatus Uhrbacteria bacterium]
MLHLPKLIDLHQDLLLHINRRDLYPDHWQTNFEMLVASQVKVVVATAFPVPLDENFLDPITNMMIEADFQEYVSRCQKSSQYSLIRTSNELLPALNKEHHTSLILHIEGLNSFTDNDWEMLERWYDLGWRSLGIVWNLTNSLGGGTKDPKSGLTDLGAKLIRWCEDKGMIVDFAHMNRPTFEAASKIVRRPILISHGNACVICQNPRNYTDEQLKQVAATGGVVGVFLARTYVTGTDHASIQNVVEQINHFRQVMGIDHIAMGTDFGGIITGHVDQLDSIECLPRLWDALIKEGYSKEDLDAITWKNSLRVLQAHLKPYDRTI